MLRGGACVPNECKASNASWKMVKWHVVKVWWQSMTWWQSLTVRYAFFACWIRAWALGSFKGALKNNNLEIWNSWYCIFMRLARPYITTNNFGYKLFKLKKKDREHSNLCQQSLWTRFKFLWKQLGTSDCPQQVNWGSSILYSWSSLLPLLLEVEVRQASGQYAEHCSEVALFLQFTGWEKKKEKGSLETND